MNFNVDVNIEEIQERLGDFKQKAPRVLCNSVNDTAKDARKLLAKQAREVYAVKSNKFQKNMTLKKAKPSNTVAVIKSKGKQMELIDFKTNPTKKTKVDSTKAKVFASGQMKNLIKSGADHNGKDLKAFIVKYQSGHVTVASRVPGETVTREIQGRNGNTYRVEADKIKSMSALAIPQMLKNKSKVYNEVKPMINRRMRVHLERHIERALRT